MRESYPTDISDEQWNFLEPLIPEPKSSGRPRTVDMREVINASFYILPAGCAWRLLPHEFPAWQTVYYYFRCRSQDQPWMRMNDQLREWGRISQAQAASPSAASLDSQSVKTDELIEHDIGYNGAKKIKGRKRHQLVDRLGLLVCGSLLRNNACTPLTIQTVGLLRVLSCAV